MLSPLQPTPNALLPVKKTPNNAHIPSALTKPNRKKLLYDHPGNVRTQSPIMEVPNIGTKLDGFRPSEGLCTLI